MQFFSRGIAYIEPMHVMKIGPDVPSVAKTRSTSQWNPSSRRQTKKEPQIAFSGKFGKNGAKRLHSGQCVLHPKALQHSLTECKKFQGLKVAERWNVVKDHGLCLNCFAVNHYTRNCRLRGCSKCSRPHHELLHDDRPNRADSSSDAAVSSTPQGESRSDSTTIGKLQDEDDGNEQVCLMLLTAVKHDEGGKTCERIPFYAAIDTGATRTLCSRDLAQKLFGQCEVMKEQLELEHRDGTITRFCGVHFVDQVLPFSNYLDKSCNRPRRIDVIFGSDYVWKHVFNSLIRQNFN